MPRLTLLSVATPLALVVAGADRGAVEAEGDGLPADGRAAAGDGSPALRVTVPSQVPLAALAASVVGMPRLVRLKVGEPVTPAALAVTV
ncbi:MAG: hypothetical protein U0232_01340 [Thermomicrobiales bacterium]